MRPAPLRADGILLLVAAIWGAGFVAQRAAAPHIPPLTFNALRYLIAFVLVGGLLVLLRRARCTRRELLGGAALAVVMTGAAWLQQAGVEHTTAARAGFFTGLYVLIVPAIGLMHGQRVGRGHLVGAVVAAAGLAMLSGDLSGGLRRGDPFVIACAVLWALHVVLTGRLAPRADALRLAAVQFLIVGVLSGVGGALLESDRWASVAQGIGPLAYSGVFSIGIAFTLQIVAQRSAPPTHAAVLMSMEAVFAAALGVLMLNERLSGPEGVGCGLMLAGCLLSQLWPLAPRAAETIQLRDTVR